MHHYIINPHSGASNKDRFLSIISLLKTDPKHVIWETTEPLEAVEFAKKAIQQTATKIIAVGGDGTINEVASVLVDSTIPLGLIPVGSGNGMARHLKLPLNYKKAFQ